MQVVEIWDIIISKKETGNRKMLTISINLITQIDHLQMLDTEIYLKSKLCVRYHNMIYNLRL